jgi:DNA adenine methylase/adenine-specific DNA-methyltransferase
MVSMIMKEHGKNVIYNDIMKFNTHVAEALLNSDVDDVPTEEEIRALFVKDPLVSYKTFIEDTFQGIFYIDEENVELDIAVQNILRAGFRPRTPRGVMGGAAPYDPHDKKRHISMYLLIQACLIKRPYNLFHRNNLSMRTSEVDRKFGNKKSWDTSFLVHMLKFQKELNKYRQQDAITSGISGLCVDDQKKPTSIGIFNSSHDDLCSCVQKDSYDTVYIDPPYFKKNVVQSDYIAYYHFLEGLVQYDKWDSFIDYESPHRKFKKEVTKAYTIESAGDMFVKCIQQYSDKNIVISYRSDGFPSISFIENELKKYKQNVDIVSIDYQYALSKTKTQEVIFLAYD